MTPPRTILVSLPPPASLALTLLAVAVVSGSVSLEAVGKDLAVSHKVGVTAKRQPALSLL